jgi:hypothetical protein
MSQNKVADLVRERRSPVETEPQDLFAVDDVDVRSSQPRDKQERVEKVGKEPEEGLENGLVGLSPSLDDIVVSEKRACQY